MSEAPEPVQVYNEETPEEQNMRNQAESLCIFDPEHRVNYTDRVGDTLHIFTTRTEESHTHTAHIDPNTGHIFDPNEAAAHHATGPD
jgi:hypothetical protein